MEWVRKHSLPSRRETTICFSGLRAIERVKGVHNTTVMAWVEEVAQLLPNAYAPETIPQVGDLDELETFVGQKKTKSPKGYRSAYGFGQR